MSSAASPGAAPARETDAAARRRARGRRPANEGAAFPPRRRRRRRGRRGEDAPRGTRRRTARGGRAGVAPRGAREEGRRHGHRCGPLAVRCSPRSERSERHPRRAFALTLEVFAVIVVTAALSFVRGDLIHRSVEREHDQMLKPRDARDVTSPDLCSPRDFSREKSRFSSKRRDRSRTASAPPPAPARPSRPAAMTTSTHPLDDLDAAEIALATSAVKTALAEDAGDDEESEIRFSYVTLREPPKREMTAFVAGDGAETQAPGGGSRHDRREARVVRLRRRPARRRRRRRRLGRLGRLGRVERTHPRGLPADVQARTTASSRRRSSRATTPCARSSSNATASTPADFAECLVCDPWSVHVATPDFEPLRWPRRRRRGATHPVLPLLAKLRGGQPVREADRPPPRGGPQRAQGDPRLEAARRDAAEDRVQRTTSTITARRSRPTRTSRRRTGPPSKPLHVVQPDGPNFVVSDDRGRVVTWDKWSMRLGFNYREGLVIHDVAYDGRGVVKRASLVDDGGAVRRSEPAVRAQVARSTSAITGSGTARIRSSSGATASGTSATSTSRWRTARASRTSRRRRFACTRRTRACYGNTWSIATGTTRRGARASSWSPSSRPW